MDDFLGPPASQDISWAKFPREKLKILIFTNAEVFVN
jgi:hypothetical protein